MKMTYQIWQLYSWEGMFIYILRIRTFLLFSSCFIFLFYQGIEYVADVYNMAIIWVGTTIFSLAEVLIMLIDLLIIAIYKSKSISKLQKNDSKVEHSNDELDDNESNKYRTVSYANLTVNISVSESKDSGVHSLEVEHQEDVELEDENCIQTKDNGAPPLFHDFYSQLFVNDDARGGTKLKKRNKCLSYKKSKVSVFSSTDKEGEGVSSIKCQFANYV